MIILQAAQSSLSSSVQGNIASSVTYPIWHQTWHPLVNVTLCSRFLGNSRAVRFWRFAFHERLKGFSLCLGSCMCVGFANWFNWLTLKVAGRVVTSMRSVADLPCFLGLAMRHISIAQSKARFPPAASLSHLCRRWMPIVLRRPAPMELAELVAGATIKRRLRSKTDNSEDASPRKQPIVW